MKRTKRILIVATSDIHLQVFHLPYFSMLKSQGYDIDAAVEIRGDGRLPGIDKLYNLPFKRTLFTFKLLKAYTALKRIIDAGEYDLIHCHTPIPAALTRLAARAARAKGTIVMYTAHGFHFYKGAPWTYWMTYYPAEKYFSRMTDAIVTINQEDFNVAKSKFHAGQTFHIHGIGVDTSRFEPIEAERCAELAEDIGLPAGAFKLIYVANFITRKNHRFIVECLSMLKKQIPDLHVLFAGSGILMGEMQQLVRTKGLVGTVHFLGFRNDINRLLAISDVCISASRQEGLGLALAEAMVCGVPVVATADRGHKELIQHGKNGFLYDQGSKDEFIGAILKLYKNPALASAFSASGVTQIRKFSISHSLESMNNIYNKFLTGSAI